MRIGKFLAIIMLVLCVSAPPCMAEVNEVDSNFDGKIDQWQYVNDEGEVEKIEHDGDHDGKIDQTEFFKGKKILEHVEFDRNKDGKMDHMQYYENGGKLARVEKSSKFDDQDPVLRCTIYVAPRWFSSISCLCQSNWKHKP